MKTDSYFLKCDCSCHMAEFQKFELVDDNEESTELFVTIWQLGRKGEILTWKERIRWCWEILKTGAPWSDNVIVSPEEALELSEWLRTNFSTIKPRWKKPS